ncbi:hypothetical protein [Massilia sp. NP310]|uniref:hypothetical protein n=1 Tax=Massilia sp. NP310 TaxID=2861282 RepID=UPI001C629B79|nr:hypothetical protein [Massilia sp. NP310]QYG02233.1 hypothetical protein KY496_01945 [Massilia sp. NP310]
MARKPAQQQTKPAAVDHAGISERFKKMMDSPQDYRPATLSDHLKVHSDEISQLIGRGYTSSQIAVQLNDFVEVSEQALRKFIKENGLAASKAKASTDAPKQAPAAVAASPKPHAAKAA